MWYDPHNPLDIANARLRLDNLISMGKPFSITAQQMKRTIDQNSYLHILIDYVAVYLGESKECVKENYYKILCNPDLFVSVKYDQFLKCQRIDTRSSADLTTEEMSQSIEAFRNWASKELALYLPEPHERDGVAQMQLEIKKNEKYLF